MSEKPMSETEKEFIHEYTRVYLVDWCCQTLVHGHIVSVDEAATTAGQKALAPKCLEYAETKGWVGKSTPKKVVASGYKIATSFLRR